MIELAQRLIAGDRRALARLLSYVENEREGVEQALAVLFAHTGRAYIVGVTGAPGTGKSSLVNALAKACRARGQTVGILAVDPTSPFTGGAILGDRIRMRDLSGDGGVFIRSMATRGSLGGLARAARDAVRLLDAAGFDLVLVETVGAGQSEVEIARAAHTTLVVEAPGLGDDVQAIKAGMLEIADVLVVNKADRPGAVNTVRALKAMLELGHPAARSQMISHHGRLMPAAAPVNGDEDASLWIPPVVQTVATEDKGIGELLAALDAHRAYLADGEALARREREQIAIELTDRLRDALLAEALAALPPTALAALAEQVQARELDPQGAVQRLLAALPGR
ncbi:MAG: methylmalonyl Co-A mutase-associated GTPase MeaB [Aggregatilineales bacterium]